MQTDQEGLDQVATDFCTKRKCSAQREGKTHKLYSHGVESFVMSKASFLSKISDGEGM